MVDQTVGHSADPKAHPWAVQWVGHWVDQKVGHSADQRALRSADLKVAQKADPWVDLLVVQ